MTLILGGTGKTGRRVAERLRARGRPVRIGSRSGGPPFDWEDRSTLELALDGATSAYVSFYPDLAIPGAPDAIGAFAELAVATGTRRLVLLSGRGEQRPSGPSRRCRPRGRRGRSCAAAGSCRTSARVSCVTRSSRAGLLAGRRHARAVRRSRRHRRCGRDRSQRRRPRGRGLRAHRPPPAVFAEAVGEIAQSIGRPVAFTQLSIDDYAQALCGEGLPEDAVTLITYLFIEVLDGRNAHLTDGVRRALGRQPCDFAQFAADGAANGVWSTA